MSADAIVEALPHLQAAEVYAALACYLNHPAGVDAEIDADGDPETLRALSGGRLETFGA